MQPNKLVNNDHGNYITANFTGHPFDTVISFYYVEARFYDPGDRAFVSRDTAGMDGVNWYAYCANNPASMWDPTGTIEQDAKEYKEKYARPLLSWWGQTPEAYDQYKAALETWMNGYIDAYNKAPAAGVHDLDWEYGFRMVRYSGKDLDALIGETYLELFKSLSEASGTEGGFYFAEKLTSLLIPAIAQKIPYARAVMIGLDIVDITGYFCAINCLEKTKAAGTDIVLIKKGKEGNEFPVWQWDIVNP